MPKAKISKKTNPAVKTISKTAAASIIKSTKGRIFSATFTKKDGTTRTLTGKIGVTKGVKGTSPSPDVSTLGYVRVYDMVGSKWRMLNLQTVTNLKHNKANYTVR